MRISVLSVTIMALGFVVAPAASQDLESVADAARDYDPALALPHADGLVHVADFDGDGREDVVAILVGTDRRALVVFRRLNGAYQPLPLYAALPASDIELRVVPPGSRRILGGEGMVEHLTPAIELVFPGRSSALYVWRRGRFQVFGTESY